MSRQDQNILADILTGIKELQLNMVALKQKTSRIQDTEVDTTARQASASILQMNDAFATEQSVTKISSTARQTIIKDLVQILDYMSVLIQKGSSLPGMRFSGWDSNDLECYFEDKLQPLSFSTFPTGIVPSNQTAVSTIFATLETSVGRLDLLLQLSQSHKVGHVTSENALESKFLAKVSLLPGANLSRRLRSYFGASNYIVSVELFSNRPGYPSKQSGGAIHECSAWQTAAPPKKWRDSLQIEKPQAQTAMNTAGPYLA
ncbi:uncharacterized protein Z519_04461 [Cladophialophora bantiana CBS 173.52]|uniref:Uncharacterized protein n=1 Tax=Cladophialophora bantiana (strain ATCC 10958 / CBS 173.52 / CDC B-1940 / NIH 8579) TaxID=1442370 RepID=A0A0D2HUD6_CLAB1|nr:uncharacterized protein Z519_04461 [Cladophialophora bantiana CBS 173.52]KIW94485.1 hypothetical protein Z519_04461 [Cladophialophora bantiana CBS 173.52]